MKTLAPTAAVFEEQGPVAALRRSATADRTTAGRHLTRWRPAVVRV
ncbi:hypothetical protein NLX86_23305 [Streptomyces sp. A3M-1-3]|nr:hypothetical protein [Streptomyces sp. A3M-1-3]MCP3820915.1 hypothetical protein [Streptomyces sp. A3M-1-3]